MPTNVEFWFDPMCPFTWITSRWIERVRPERDLSVRWRPFSLFVSNDPPADSPMRERAERGRNLLRVVAALDEAGEGHRIGELYTELGRRIHHHDETEIDVVAALDRVGLPGSFASAEGDEAFDRPVAASMADAAALVGDDVGAPVVAVTALDGTRAAMFGPVLTRLPGGSDSLRLWDGFANLVGVEHFFELKRTRTESPEAPGDASLG